MMTSKPPSLVGALLAAAVALVFASCGEEGSDGASGATSAGSSKDFEEPFKNVEAYPVFISSEIVVGQNRFLLGLLDDNDAPIGTPAIDVRVSFYDLEASGNQLIDSKHMDFIWSTRGKRGVYVTDARFTHPGKWGAEVAISGKGIDETVRASFEVANEPITPAVGERAPASDTPTDEDVADLHEISTDPHPDRRFYELSIAEAIEQHRPAVITFATPKFCTSAVCGPTLDIVKDVSESFPGVNFIHVEVYENLDDPSNLQTVPAVEEWSLQTEPWVFVIDSTGRIAAKFEGIVGEEELRTELKTLD
jgi:hypothetical protein